MSVAPRDVRAWICWGIAAMVPVLVMRNPIVLIEVMVIVLIVRATCVPPDRLAGWRWFARIAVFMLAIGVVFNVLTVHAGDRVMVSMPGSWPIVGGELSWNAFVYGVVSALAFFTLVLIGTTVASLLRWVDLIRVIPSRLAPIAVAGSVAWTFLPQMGISLKEIQEAHRARGHRLRGVRDLVPLLVPLLAGGLERALTTAEALEARGFGSVHGEGESSQTRRVNRGGMLMVAGLIALLVAAYGGAVGSSLPALVTGICGGGLLALGLRWKPAHTTAQTSYRVHAWTWRDGAIVTFATVSLVGFAWRWHESPASLRFDVYPTLTWPPVDLPVMLLLAALIVPALCVEWLETASRPVGHR